MTACLVALALLGLINVYGGALIAYDKRTAVRNRRSGRPPHPPARRRVPEKRFFLLSLLGAWPAILLMQAAVHHKTRKLSYSLLLAVTILGSLIAWGAILITLDCL